MNIYWVLAWSNYYPLGGIKNVKSCHSTLDLAEKAKNNLIQIGGYDNYSIINISSMLNTKF